MKEKQILQHKTKCHLTKEEKRAEIEQNKILQKKK